MELANAVMVFTKGNIAHVVEKQMVFYNYFHKITKIFMHENMKY